MVKLLILRATPLTGETTAPGWHAVTLELLDKSLSSLLCVIIPSIRILSFPTPYQFSAAATLSRGLYTVATISRTNEIFRCFASDDRNNVDQLDHAFQSAATIVRDASSI